MKSSVFKIVSVFTLMVSIFIFAGCATLSPEGAQVEIVTLKSTNNSEVEAAVKDLEKRNCVFIENIEAQVEVGSSDVNSRLIIGLKNKTAKVGGNTVISSLTVYSGMPIYTKGKVYKCPKNVTSKDV